MNTKESVNVLKAHNEWRRGHGNDMPHGPATIGEAIDTMIAEVENPRYFAKDVQSFFSWADNNGWYYGKLTELWYNDEEEFEGLTIEEILKIWKEATKL